jgi:hypothetical protein
MQMPTRQKQRQFDGLVRGDTVLAGADETTLVPFNIAKDAGPARCRELAEVLCVKYSPALTH